MAISIGDLVANVDADISGLQRGFKQAEAQIVHLGRSFKTLESGILVPATAAVTKVEKEVDRVATTAKNSATPAINTLRGAFGSMAAQAARVPGPLGAIAGQLGSLAFGSLTTAGVLAGITGVTLLIREMGEAAREEKARIEELFKMDPAGRQAFARDVQAMEDAFALRDKARAELAGTPATVTNMRLVPGPLGDMTAEAVTTANPRVAELEEVIRRTSLLIDDLAKKYTKQAGATKGVTEEIEKEIIRRRAIGGDGSIRLSGLEQGIIAERERVAAEGALRRSLLPFGTGLSPSTASPDMGVLRAGDAPPAAPSAASRALDSLVAGAEEAGSVLKFNFGPASLAMAGIFEVIRGVLEPLQPVIEAVGMLLQAVGNVIGSLLLPILKPIAAAFSYVLQAIGYLIEGLGKFVDKVIPDFVSKAGKGLAKAGQQMQDDAKKARDGLKGGTEGTETLGEAATRTAEALSNVPSGYKVALARFNASSPEVRPGSLGGGMGNSPNWIQQVFQPGAFQMNAKDPESLWRDLARIIEREAQRGGTTALALART